MEKYNTDIRRESMKTQRQTCGAVESVNNKRQRPTECSGLPLASRQQAQKQRLKKAMEKMGLTNLGKGLVYQDPCYYFKK